MADVIVLAAEQMSRRFRGRTVLSAASLWAEAGSLTSLMGRNGSGKTTLLRLAAGVLRPHGGRVRFAGLETSRPRLAELARRGLFYLPQDGVLAATLTVRQHLEAMARRFSATGLTDVVSSLRLEALLERRRTELSWGERMRASLALAVLREPVCLLADEPFTGLAPKDRELVGSVLRALADRGCATVATGHETRELFAVADAVVWTVAGTTHQLGSPESARRHDQFRREYLGPSA